MYFIKSSYNEKDGISKVIVQHLGKKFIGFARCHPEEENPSSFAGCAIAELRAEIKALKYERKILKQEADAVKIFVNNCKNYKLYNSSDKTSIVMHHQLNTMIDRVNDITDEINKRTKAIELTLNKRENIINAINKKYRTKEENIKK